MTLIEMLIAVSLLSLLSVGVLVAMRIGFTTMAKTDEHLVRNRRVANARKIIENEIEGFTLTRADWRPKPDVIQSAPFVEWRPDGMRFVTTYSLQDAWRGRPQIAEMQVIPGENGIGVRLIVNETPYTGPAQTGLHITGIDEGTHFIPVLPGPGSFVLADKLAYCRFAYLEPRPEPPLLVWRPDWVQVGVLPRGIRIEMAPLDAQGRGLQIGTIIVQLNARPELAGYRDVQ